MDGASVDQDITIGFDALDLLMPMHLCLSPSGQIVSAGATLEKLFPDALLLAHSFFDLFDVRRPGGVASMADLTAHAGERLYLAVLGGTLPAMRGIVVPRAKGQGLLLNLSFGIGVIDAVRHHALTGADFAPTDLTVELMYLVEAKSAVMDELRNLNLRLQGAKVAAEEQALTDTLTGLRNRRALETELALLARQSVPFCLMHIDLDYFKAVNDTLGHAAGDHVLREVAQVLGAETRHGDTVARVGGDEFVVVLPALSDAAVLHQIALRIINRLSLPMEYDGQPCRIAGSIGMTISSNYAATDLDRMLGDADHALYASKRAGRGRATLFHEMADDGGPTV